jgi:hypothetical protein
MPYPVAIEVARQMNAGAGNGDVRKLLAIGMPLEHAKELTSQINAGAFSESKLALAGINHSIARTLKRTSGL